MHTRVLSAALTFVFMISVMQFCYSDVEYNTVRALGYNFTYITKESPQCEFSTWSDDARHCGIDWRTYRHAFTPRTDDLMYFDTRWIGSSFAKIFYQYGEKDSRVRIDGNIAYLDGNTYGLLFDNAYKHEYKSQNTVKYIEINREMEESDVENIIKNYGQIEIVNLRTRIDYELAARLTSRLPVIYVHWGFIDSQISPLASLDEYFKIVDEDNLELELWFHGFYEGITLTCKIRYIHVTCVPDWVVGYIKGIAAQLIWIKVSARISSDSIRSITKAAVNLRGFIYDRLEPFSPDKSLTCNGNIIYFKGRTSSGISCAWPRIVACSAYSNYYCDLPSTESLRDVQILETVYWDEKYTNMLRFPNVVRINGCCEITRLYTKSPNERLRIIETTLIVNAENYEWFIKSVTSIRGVCIAIDKEALPMNNVCTNVKEMIAYEFWGGFLEMALKYMPEGGYTRLALFGQIVYCDEDRFSHLITVKDKLRLFGMLDIKARPVMPKGEVIMPKISKSIAGIIGFTGEQYNSDDIIEALYRLSEIKR